MNKYNFLDNTTFLVTGGAGFIGSNIVKELLEQDCQVRGLDNFATGKRENIEEFMDNDNFELLEGDIRNIDICQQACSDIDYVLHQAALGSVPRSIEDPITTNEVNIDGTLNMLVAARDNEVKRFIYASSSSVYGDSEELPKVEENVGTPLSPYAITKKNCELYANNFYQLYDLETIGFRYFNVYGPKQDPFSQYAAVIPIFVKQLLNDERPTIHGDGGQSRDFTFVGDVIQANLNACQASKDACGRVYNIAYGGRTYLNDLYDKLCDLLDRDIEPIYGAPRPGDVRHSNADVSKAQKYLDYDSQYNINQGLEKAINWYKNNI